MYQIKGEINLPSFWSDDLSLTRHLTNENLGFISIGGESLPLSPSTESLESMSGSYK